MRWFSWILLIVLGGCASAPDWVRSDSPLGAGKAKVFRGIGAAEPGSAATVAGERAKGDLAQTFDAYAQTVAGAYLLTHTDEADVPVNRLIATLKTVGSPNARLRSSWVDPETGITYTLAELDLADVLRDFAHAPELRGRPLPPEVHAFVMANAERLFEDYRASLKPRGR